MRPRTEHQGRSWRSALALAALLALLTTLPATAAGKPYLPPKGKDFLGVTDTGEIKKFRYFKQLVGKHPPVMGTTDTWGVQKLKGYFLRWRQAAVRPMLSISTAKGWEGEEVISPRSIAMGGGDNYLLVLNRLIHEWRRPIYIRLMAEPNGHWNPYSAYNEDGSHRGSAHTTGWYRQAWRRVTIMLRDGGTLRHVNRRLGRIGLPKVKKPKAKRLPRQLWRNKVAMLWVPQTFGSPNIPGNRPVSYWPGSRYVDWVGTDFYSKFPTWDALNRFYRAWGGKPFVFGEWGVWGADDPGFVRRFFKWQRSHRRVRMFVYYNGLTANPLNPFNIEGRPRSRREMRRQLTSKRYPGLAPEWRRPRCPASGGVGVRSTARGDVRRCR